MDSRSKIILICRLHESMYQNTKGSTNKFHEHVHQSSRKQRCHSKISLTFQYNNNKPSKKIINDSIPLTKASESIWR